MTRNTAIGLGVLAVVLIVAGVGFLATRGGETPPEGAAAGAADEPEGGAATAAKPGADEPGTPGGGFLGGPVDGPHTVVMVVMDTVRSENTSLCGYERPTTPFMIRLRDQFGASVACNAYTSGAWTLPTHASFFTGLPVHEHGLFSPGAPLNAELDTIAEQMSDRGYRTVMVSGNGILSERAGMHQGFDRALVSTPEFRMWGPDLAGAVRKVLQRVPVDDPLFLFVNIYDAHDPYPEIPEGVEWAEPQDSLWLFEPDFETPRPEFTNFVNGKMKGTEKKELLTRITNGYDYGIFSADQSLARTFMALRDSGRIEKGFRVAITSDHGEFLGEHANLRHGCFVYEQVTQVPLVYYDSANPGTELPEPIQATAVYDLLLNGELSSDTRPPSSVSYRRDGDRPSADMVGIWSSIDEKIAWKEGDFLHFDLKADPEEARPKPLGEHKHRAMLEEIAAWHQSSRGEMENDPALQAMLRKLGYIDGVDEGGEEPEEGEEEAP